MATKIKSTLYCSLCGENKLERNFYKSHIEKYNTEIYKGRAPFCMNCINKIIYPNGKLDRDAFIRVLKDFLDLRYDEEVYTKAVLSGKKNILSEYIKKLNLTKKIKYNGDISWHEENEENKKETTINIDDKTVEISDVQLEKLKEKFGVGYKNEEYILFENKYQQLRPNARLLTTFHVEFFKEYCVDKVKETLAKGKGDFKEAKEWASMAKDAATAGKLNPSQMSKADLSGGMDTFGQMARMVEEHPKGELMSILPQFIAKPKDKVDVTLWCYVNYVRDLKGLPECEYKDIYAFYEERRKAYEKQMLDSDISSDNTEGDIQ